MGETRCQVCTNRSLWQALKAATSLVTVLFADVVGSTAMAEQLDPEQVIDIMNGAFAFLNANVARYGGTVARLMGDAILALFGAPVTHEDDAERAVRAGLGIQSAAREYARQIQQRYGLDFQVRVGINSGLAVLAFVGDQIRAEYTAMGDTTNVAARLQSLAEPGSVLISADTYRLVKPLFEVKPLGAIEVKGKSIPVETYRVLALKEAPGNLRGLEGISSRVPSITTAAATWVPTCSARCGHSPISTAGSGAVPTPTPSALKPSASWTNWRSRCHPPWPFDRNPA